MSEAVDYVALLTAVPSVLVVGDESFEFSLGLAEAAAARGKWSRAAAKHQRKRRRLPPLPLRLCRRRVR